MLQVLVDAAVLLGVLYMLLGEEAPDFYQVFFVALGMAAVNLVCSLALAPSIGLFVIVPILLIDGLILMYYCHLTIKYAAIALAILLAYNVASYAFWRWALG